MKHKYLIPLIIGFALSSALYWGLKSQDSIDSAVPFAMAGKPVPSFSLPSLTGEPLDASLFTSSWTLLNVWASWCSSCKAEHDYLMTLNAQQVPIVGLNYRDESAAALAVLEKTGNPYQTVIFDPQGTLALDLGSIVTPETYLIDENGILIYRHTGVLNESVWQQHFQPRIDKLIAQENAS